MDSSAGRTIPGFFILLIPLTLVMIIGHVRGQANQDVQRLDCETLNSCDQCIESQHCVWCSQESMFDNKDPKQRFVKMSKRCVTPKYASEMLDKWCPKKMIVGRINDTIETSPAVTKGASLSLSTIKMAMYKGEKQRITIKYTHEEDYPVDLYFLMDLSTSMVEHRNKLSTLGSDLAIAMKNLTSKFSLGFGSFIDKVTLPMSTTDENWLKYQCHRVVNGKRPVCAYPYAFKNQMSLNSDITLFKEKVYEAEISGNIDSPEGGLDAMMQAFVCTDQIGWREEARHLLVYSSDASYHIAGDGKLAGLVEPNDEQCHLNTSGYYDHAERLDYPSIGQISTVAREKNINVIFAVTEQVVEEYEALSKRIDDSKVGVLDSRSESVVQLIREYYATLVKKVSMTYNAHGSMIDLEFRVKCPGSKKHEQKRSCDNMRKGDIAEYLVDVEVKECPENPKEFNRTIEIFLRGMADKVIVEVDLICSCPCSSKDHESYRENSDECNKNGDLVCGICKCNEDHYGDDCGCSQRHGSQNNTPMDSCRPTNTSDICSNRGECQCGRCYCSSEKYSGQFCQWDKKLCEDENGKVCGEHGYCIEGQCVCADEYSGEKCDCDGNTDDCKEESGSDDLCSNHGTCKCNRCECNTDEFYYGSTCAHCPDCYNSACNLYGKCVECRFREANATIIQSSNDPCSTICPGEWDTWLVDNITLSEDQKRERYQLCNHINETGCIFQFHFKEIGSSDVPRIAITILKTVECPPPPNVLALAIGVVVGTLLLGLLILIAFKVLTSVWDAREYAKFEKERAAAKWGSIDNPLYIPATSTFQNPTYSKN